MAESIINEREREHAAELTAAHVPIPEWWFRKSALLTFLLNASSTTIPEGERFIIRAARDAQELATDQELKDRAEVLIHEETAHARMHDAYNNYLTAQGFCAKKYGEETKRLIYFLEKRFSLFERLATCTMIEHFTAIFGKQVLDTGIFEGEDVDERMDRIWSWHSLEELEHRSTAFDLYRELGGGYFTRIYMATVTSVLFAFVHTRCLLAYLAEKKLLWKWKTWADGLPYVIGEKGVYRLFLSDWFLFYKPGFHPYDIHLSNRYGKQLHHYHIENELIEYFTKAG